MNLYIYSDESGVFDRANYDWFAYGGLIFTDGFQVNKLHNEFESLEKLVRKSRGIDDSVELKSAILQRSDRRRLFNATKHYMKFGAVIELKKINAQIFAEKKTKQRYLDFALRRSIRNCLTRMVEEKLIVPSEIQNLFFYTDEHTTATSGKYELHSALEQEYIIGTFDPEWNIYMPPLFPSVATIKLKYCNSELVPEIRAADIIANKMLNNAIDGKGMTGDKMIISRFPTESGELTTRR